MQPKLRILIALVLVYNTHYQMIGAMSGNIQRALSTRMLPSTLSMSLVTGQQIFPRISTSLMRRNSISPIVAHNGQCTLAHMLQQTGADDSQGDKEHTHNNSGWQRWRTLLGRLGSFGTGAALITGLSTQALREARADEQEQEASYDFISAHMRSLFSEEVDPLRIKNFVKTLRNDEHVYKQCMHLLPAHFVQLLQTEAGDLFIRKMFKTEAGFKDLTALAVECLTKELAMHRLGEPFNANICIVLLRVPIDWQYFSTYRPQTYVKLIKSLCTDVTQFASVHVTNIKRMLLGCPRAYHLPCINALLQYYDDEQYAKLPPNEATYLAELLADLIILFELDIDVQYVAQSETFADNILQKMLDLRTSYNYHARHPLNNNKSALRTWVKAELNDERNRMLRIVEQDLGVRINIDQLKAQSARQRTQMSGELHDREDGLNAYMRRKLRALGFSFDRPIEINHYGSMAVNPTAWLDSENGVSQVKCQLEINDDLVLETSPFAFNFTLAHEMIHYYDFHNDLNLTIEAATRNKLPNAKITPYTKGVAVHHILDEKIADAVACLHLGPAGCYAGASALAMSNVVRAPDQSCHAPLPVRTAALAACAVAMHEEDAGWRFDPQQDTAFTLWMRTKNRHPDQEVFLNRFYR